jgi:hypothetical protein
LRIVLSRSVGELILSCSQWSEISRAGHWHLDLAARRLYVHTKPHGDGRYELVHVLAEGDAVTPPGTTTSLRVAALLP